LPPTSLSFPTRRSSDLLVDAEGIADFLGTVFPRLHELEDLPVGAAEQRPEALLELRLGGLRKITESFGRLPFLINQVQQLQRLQDRKSTRLNSSHEWIS